MAWHRAWILHTAPGQASLFSPPAGVEDYRAWLQARYRAGLETIEGRTVCSGLAQLVNAIAADVRQHKTHVVLVGPYAAEALDLLGNTIGAGAALSVHVIP